MTQKPIKADQIKQGDDIALSGMTSSATVVNVWQLKDSTQVKFDDDNDLGIDFIIMKPSKVVMLRQPLRKIRADEVRPGMVMTCGRKDRMVKCVTLSMDKAVIELEGCATDHILMPGAPVEIV